MLHRVSHGTRGPAIIATMYRRRVGGLVDLTSQLFLDQGGAVELRLVGFVVAVGASFELGGLLLDLLLEYRDVFLQSSLGIVGSA